MTYVATITSKRQFTIPAKLFTQIGLTKGDKVLIEEKNGGLLIKPALDLVDRLAGSVSITKDMRGIDLDSAIKQAKEMYFRSKE